MEIADLIRELQQRLQISPKELAAVLGVSSETVSEWELGLSQPGRHLLKRIETLLTLSLEADIVTNPNNSILKFAEINQEILSVADIGSSVQQDVTSNGKSVSLKFSSLDCLLPTILENTIEGCLLVNSDWICVYANHATKQFLDKPLNQLIGESIWDIFSVSENSSFYCSCQQAIAQQCSIEFEEFYSTFNRWLQVRFLPLQAVFCIYFQDVTEQKQVEETLQQNPNNLKVMQRNITEQEVVGEERTQLIHEQAARAVAETAEQRSAFLATVSAVLASSLDYEQTLQSVANLAVPYFADWCSVDLLNEDRTISRVAVAHSDPEKVELGWKVAQRFPRHLDDGYGISKVMQTGQVEIAPEITDEQIAAAVQDSDYLEVLRELGLSSCIIAPLEARGRILGTISLVYADSKRHYQRIDLGLVEDLARRAAIAIDNARLHQEAQQAKAEAELAVNRTARLLAVMQALSESLTPVEVAKVIIEHSMAALGANSGLVALLRENNELEIIQSIGYKQAFSNDSIRFFSINEPFPLAEAIRTGIPMWLETVENRIARYPHLAQAYAQTGAKAWMSIPLFIDGRAVGGLSLSFATVPSLSEDDHTFVMVLAQQSAQSVERARLYESEQKARAEAETANQVKDQFLAIVSHELRTPLNSILGWAQILRSRKLNEATMARALETIERNARSQNQLIDDLLDVSRILRGKLKLQLRPIDLTAVIESAIDSISVIAEAKQICLQTQLDAEASLISGDPNRLQQVVWNLLSNAIKFTPAGGRIEVKLEKVECSALNGTKDLVYKSKIETQNLHSYAQVTITDTGMGISPNFLPHIFEYFRQADSSMTRSHGGLGLGLAIVRNLIELHGGTVHADSLGESQGSTFIIRLPMLTASNKKETLASFVNRKPNLTSESLTVLAGLRVLVVDDEADTRGFLLFSLEQVGATVVAAASAEDALQQLTAQQPNILISDIGMPNMDGLSLMRRIRELEKEQGTFLPAIALTAYAGQEYEKQTVTAGFQMYLAKPVDISELIKAVHELTLARPR